MLISPSRVLHWKPVYFESHGDIMSNYFQTLFTSVNCHMASDNWTNIGPMVVRAANLILALVDVN